MAAMTWMIVALCSPRETAAPHTTASPGARAGGASSRSGRCKLRELATLDKHQPPDRTRDEVDRVEAHFKGPSARGPCCPVAGRRVWFEPELRTRIVSPHLRTAARIHRPRQGRQSRCWMNAICCQVPLQRPMSSRSNCWRRNSSATRRIASGTVPIASAFSMSDSR